MPENSFMSELHKRDVQTARMEEQMKTVKSELDEIRFQMTRMNKKIDEISWKLAGVVAIVSLAIQIYFSVKKG